MAFHGNNALLGAAGAGKSLPFTVTFLTGTTPATIALHSTYTGPANAALAEYDPGNGVWANYTSKTITVSGSYVSFRGDWRNVAGGYYGMFQSTFAGTAYTCKFSGALEFTPSAFASCYREIFRGCNAVTSIEHNPLPILTGAPADRMYNSAFQDMTNVTGALPAGFMDTSGLTGPAADRMVQHACYQMTNVTGAIPAGFMDTSSLTGAPRPYMFWGACQYMTNVTGALPAGFMDTSGLTGAPSLNMYREACQGMTKVTSGNINIGNGVTLTPTNVVGPLNIAFRGMTLWTGQVYWGAQVLVEAIPVPNADTDAFRDSINMPNYATIHVNWK